MSGMVWVIVAMAAATFPSRLLPMALLRRSRLRPEWKVALETMAFCIIVSLTVADFSSDPELVVWKVLALIPTIATIWVAGNIGVGIIVGVAAYSMAISMLG